MKYYKKLTLTGVGMDIFQLVFFYNYVLYPYQRASYFYNGRSWLNTCANEKLQSRRR